MKVISELKYTQPSGIRIKLRELEIPRPLFGYPYSAERLIGYGSNFRVQEASYGWPRRVTKEVMMRWRHFEERLQLGKEV